jgi:hypothetical protein
MAAVSGRNEMVCWTETCMRRGIQEVCGVIKLLFCNAELRHWEMASPKAPVLLRLKSPSAPVLAAYIVVSSEG